MAEYIDRKSLIDEFDRLGLGEHSFVERVFSDGVRTIIAGMPAADVAPVVRCKDCKHFRVYIGRDMCAKNAKLLGGREVGLCATGKDDFCNYGERKKR